MTMPTTLPTDKIISCFYDSSEDCVKVLNMDGILMSFNPNGYTAMEIEDPKSVIGHEWLEFWDGDMKAKATEALAKAQHGSIARFEGYCPTLKGTMKYWEVTIAPLHDEYNNVAWLLVTSRDMSRQKELEELVAKQAEQIKALQLQQV